MKHFINFFYDGHNFVITEVWILTSLQDSYSHHYTSDY